MISPAAILLITSGSSAFRPSVRAALSLSLSVPHIKIVSRDSPGSSWAWQKQQHRRQEEHRKHPLGTCWRLVCLPLCPRLAPAA